MSPSTCCTTAHIHNKPLRCRFCECNVLSLDEAGMRAIYRLLNSESRDAHQGFGGRCGCKSHTIAQMWGEQRMPSRHRVAAGIHLLHMPTLHSIWSFSSNSFTLVLPESCFHSCRPSAVCRSARGSHVQRRPPSTTCQTCAHKHSHSCSLWSPCG